MENFVGLENGFSSTTCHGFREDDIVIVVVENHAVVVSIAGRSNEFSSLICVDLSSGFKNGGIAEMGARIAVIGWREHVGFVVGFAMGFKVGGSGRVCRSFGGALVLTCLIEVAFDHGNGV